MNISENLLYLDDIKSIATLDLPWNLLKNKKLLISGATGMIGSFLIDVIMFKNKNNDLNCTVLAAGRNENKAKKRFEYCINSKNFEFVNWDVNKEVGEFKHKTVDFVLHLASNTHPIAYATDPIGTITTNIIGTKNMLDFASEHNTTRCLFASSNEIYGENRGDVEKFKEDYCGYIDSNTLRAGYPESKRCSEALCQAYIRQKNLDIVIARLTRSYGPTLLSSDTKALSQFIHKGLNKEDIVLKSEGTQYYSYTYVSDAVSGLLTILLKGENGEAYNIADEKSDIMLKDLAKLIADYSGRSVRFELPDELEKSGYSKATKARLDNFKIKELGWSCKYNIKEGIYRTLDILNTAQ